MLKKCKLCDKNISIRYTNNNIDYYYCAKCDFLQNFYWEENSNLNQKKITVHEEFRTRRWPKGKENEMYKLGRVMLDYMASPVAWKSRKVHSLFKKYLPGYNNWNKKFTKYKMPRLLDYGCGHGLSVREMRRRDGLNIIGLDPYSPVNNPHIIRNELITEHFPDNFFNGIFSVETLEHIPNVLEEFAELHRILKKDGVMLIQTSRLEDPKHIAQQGKWFYLREPETHVSIYSEPAMRLIAKKVGFSNIQFRGVRYARFTK